MIFCYQEIEFLISENKVYFLYKKMNFDIEKSFSNIKKDLEMF